MIFRCPNCNLTFCLSLPATERRPQHGAQPLQQPATGRWPGAAIWSAPLPDAVTPWVPGGAAAQLRRRHEDGTCERKHGRWRSGPGLGGRWSGSGHSVYATQVSPSELPVLFIFTPLATPIRKSAYDVFAPGLMQAGGAAPATQLQRSPGEGGIMPPIQLPGSRRPSFRVPHASEDIQNDDSPGSPDKGSPVLTVDEDRRMRRRGSQL